MTRRRSAVLAALLAGAGVLLASTRTWLSGRAADPLLDGSLLSVTGSQAAPAAVGLTVVGIAALVATLTAGPRLRVAATVVLLVSAAGGTYAVARLLLDPAGALAARAVEQIGRTGPVPAEASVAPWAWIALGFGLAFVASGVWVALASRGAAGLSRRFDRPAPEAPPEGPRSAWDALSEGRDPTAGSDVGRT